MEVAMLIHFNFFPVFIKDCITGFSGTTIAKNVPFSLFAS